MDLSKYAIGTTGVDTSALVLKRMACWKIRVDNVDLDKLKIISADLSKPGDVVDLKDNDVVKRTVYCKLVTKVNATDSNTKH